LDRVGRVVILSPVSEVLAFLVQLLLMVEDMVVEDINIIQPIMQHPVVVGQVGDTPPSILLVLVMLPTVRQLLVRATRVVVMELITLVVAGEAPVGWEQLAVTLHLVEMVGRDNILQYRELVLHTLVVVEVSDKILLDMPPEVLEEAVTVAGIQVVLIILIVLEAMTILVAGEAQARWVRRALHQLGKDMVGLGL
jgi:hypothetical protein